MTATFYMEHEDKYISLLRDNRVLKKYTEDLRDKIKQLEQQLESKNKALLYAKSLLLLPSFRINKYQSLDKIRQLECEGLLTFTNSKTCEKANPN